MRARSPRRRSDQEIEASEQARIKKHVGPEIVSSIAWMISSSWRPGLPVEENNLYRYNDATIQCERVIGD